MTGPRARTTAVRRLPGARMSRNYALTKLLEHGPLTIVQLRQITGWKAPLLHNALYRLTTRGTLAIANLEGQRHYRLVAAPATPVATHRTTTSSTRPPR